MDVIEGTPPPFLILPPSSYFLASRTCLLSSFLLKSSMVFVRLTFSSLDPALPFFPATESPLLVYPYLFDNHLCLRFPVQRMPTLLVFPTFLSKLALVFFLENKFTSRFSLLRARNLTLASFANSVFFRPVATPISFPLFFLCFSPQ